MTATLPAAWIGFAPGVLPPLVRVCAWCPDKRAADAEAARLGYRVTHAICPRCCARLTAARLGEREDES